MRTKYFSSESLPAWCGPAFLVLTLVGFLIAGLLPPPSATESAPAIATFYRDHATAVQAGMLVALIGMFPALPFVVKLTELLKRSDPRNASLAQVQLVSGVILLIVVLMSVLMIGDAAYRPERPPALTQLLNDFGFIVLLWPFVPATVESLAVGLAVLRDRSESPLFPRWVGLLDLIVAAVFMLGGPTLFVKRGAFGWDGALAFWAVFAAFGLWVVVTSASMLRALARPPDEREPQP
jgi:hypothetical protein